MKYKEIIPTSRLKQFIKCYYIYESESIVAFEDTVFPSGHIEIIFNLGTGLWQTAKDDQFVTNPPIELWGQIIRPLAVKSIGKHIMLGIRFLPFAAGCFLNEEVEQFNNEVFDFTSITGNSVLKLHSRLMDVTNEDKRVQLVEDFLLERLSRSERRLNKIAVVSSVMLEMQREDFFDNIGNVASRHGITSRYLQRLFLQYTGLTPKLYSKINRFQNSLRLVNKYHSSLTSIAYECGYSDQSHFIREFKSFTGFTPSDYLFKGSPITLAFTQN